MMRCQSAVGGLRCQRLWHHPGWHSHHEGPTTHTWRFGDEHRETYDTKAPWITWLWLSSDRETRISGRSRMRLTCAVCGARETVRIRIPRVGPVRPPTDGIHPARREAITRHAHPERGPRMTWALPMLNPVEGIDLDQLVMRIQADVLAADPELPR